MKISSFITPIAAMSVITASLTSATIANAAGLIQGDVVVDNYFALYTGNYSAANTLYGSGGGGWGQPTPSPNNTFNFTTVDDYIYIAAWSDDAVAQGLLHDFTVNGNPLFSGNSAWDVYATGIDKDSPTIPTLGELTTQIGIANASAGGTGTSVGWVAPTVGASNASNSYIWTSLGGTIPYINGSAQWTWYQAPNTSGSSVPFQPGYDHDEYLIFRAKIQSVPEPTATLGLFALGGLAFLGKVIKTKKS